MGPTEIGMGGPMRGTLRLTIGVWRDNIGRSIVWSGDSEYLAVPEWGPAAGLGS